jgi:hypothetical protein
MEAEMSSPMAFIDLLIALRACRIRLDIHRNFTDGTSHQTIEGD